MRKRLVCFALLLVSVLFTSIYAQEYAYHIYGVDKGLPTYFTKAISQSKDRAIWVATDDGLVRFNAKATLVLKKELFSRYVKQVIWLDSALFVVSDGGIQYLDPNGEIQLKPFLKASEHANESTLYYPKGVYKAPQNQLWIIEPNALVRYFPDAPFKRYAIAEKYHDNDTYVKTYHPFTDKDGHLFIAVQRGNLLRINPKTDVVEEINLTGKGKKPEIKALIPYKLNEWIIAGDNGIHILKKITDTQFEWKPIQSLIEVTSLLLTPKGQLFIATKTDGIYLAEEKNKFKSFVKIYASQNIGLNSLFMDAEENVWATSDQGIILLQPNLFQALYYPQSFQYTQAISVSRSGFVVASSESAAFGMFENAQHFDVRPVFFTPGSQIKSSFFDDEVLIIGNSNGEIQWVRDQQVVRSNTINKTEFGTAAHPYFIKRSPDGTLWFVIYNLNGVLKLSSDGTITHYGDDKGLPARIQSFTFNLQGDMYLGGQGDSTFLFTFNKKADRFENLSTSFGEFTEANLRISDMEFDSKGTLWIVGTPGLLQYKNKTLTRVDGQQEIRAELFSALEIDSKDHLWIGAQDGLYVYQDGIFTLFNNTDGLPSLTVTYRSLRIDPKDRVWVGTINGLAYLKQPIENREKTPKPVISEIILDGKKADLSIPEIEANENSIFQFEFLAASYPETKVNYQTRLVGFDDTWKTQTGNYVASYQNIPAGNYTFQVRAHRRGFPVSEITSIPVEVATIWYKSNTAFVLYFSLMIVFTWFSVLYHKKNRLQRRAEEKLRHTEQQLHMVFQNSPMILFAIDRFGIVYQAEGRGFTEAGIPADTLIGRQITDIFTDDFFVEIISRSLLGETIQFEFHIKDRAYQTRIVPTFDETGKPGGALAVGDDLTERLVIENQLVHAREEAESAKSVAETANQAKSLFLASMSHELRTPLNAILGFSELLAKDDSINSKNQHFISILHKSGEHLLSMINDVLDLSKIEAGRLELVMKPIDFHTLLHDLKAMFELLAVEKQLGFKLVLSDSVPRYILQDENKFRQVLINLIGNAIKYTDVGRVEIEVNSTSNNTLFIAIADTGRGIPKDQIKDIFEPFKQVRGYNNKGTGLGLAICHHLSILMNGVLKVESELNKGSVFSLEIPLILPESDMTIQVKQDYSKVTGIKGAKKPIIHIVDDVQENRILLLALLEPLGFVCREAKNGIEAVNLAQNEKPDLILMDIVMPEMDGIEAKNVIRMMPGFEKMPIVAITASGFDDERQELIRNGFSEYIRKPFREHDLMEIIEEQLHVEFEYEQKIAVQEESHSQGIADEIQHLPTSEKESILEAFDMLDLPEIQDLVSKSSLSKKTQEEIQKHIKEANFSYFITLSEQLDS